MEQKLDFLRFFDACDPSRTLIPNRPEDQAYYVDFSSVRGGRIIETLERTILMRSRANQSTCQLFTGHIGCGKSTELRKLQADLEARNFHVVYFESTEDLDMADVDVTDVLLAITRQVSTSLESIGIKLKPGYFRNLLDQTADFLGTPIELSLEAKASLPLSLGEIVAKTRESQTLRQRLRQYLEPQTERILTTLNKHILKKAHEQLNAKNKHGLVVLVDNLDRVDNRKIEGSGRSQPEYLFVDRGDQLRKLDCHVVYTIPLSLIFSNDYQSLTNRFGGGIAPKTLPMVPVMRRDGSSHEEGLHLLKHMVMVRAFPSLVNQVDLDAALVTKVFDSEPTLDRLCVTSGGHVRTLLGMLYRCLQESDPPITTELLQRVINEYSNRACLAVNSNEKAMLKSVHLTKQLNGDKDHDILLRSLFVFEYPDETGQWFDVNPLLMPVISTA
ncbi:ATP-binding protein [Leptolyngbya cf. ectocarpi LEGE 11479]|uniref:ATP-binding protein n=1 Tax=Leptolyngbya cf. ectocarpi LEGE 11479 TaxID=1828722 RepID=A0A928ZXL7_LEPEC|nr:ATP-binding protein [Leptolyngbya ectocarpi]MBE9069316.1 ATP-binding protein [Leptolyngbya cf. ectocarpi LEGE 11479]